MAPNRRHPDKVMIGIYVSQRFKNVVRDRAAAEGLTQTDAIVQAIEEWLQKPPPDRS